MKSPWTIVCRELEKEYAVPKEWKQLNVQAEQLVRERLKEWVSSLDDPLLTDLPERMQVSHYQYFYAFSKTISDGILWNESDMFAYQDAFCGLDVNSYLRACAAMYCTKLVLAYHDDPTRLKTMLFGAMVMCGLPWRYAEEWLHILSHANDEDRFSSELSVHLYQEMAEVLGLSREPDVLKVVAHDSKWNGLAVIISGLHNDYDTSDDCVEYARTVLGQSSDKPNAVCSRSSSVVNPAFRVDPAGFVGAPPLGAEVIIDAISSAGSSQDGGINSIIISRARIAKIMAEDLGTPISETEAISIAKNSLTPQMLSEPVPLTPRKRAIAEEMQFHAWTAFASKDNKLRGLDAHAMAKSSVAAGERGRTAAMKIGEKAGCLVLFVIVIASGAIACMPFALLVGLLFLQ